MRTLITGATGLIGRHLLARAENAVILSRDAGRAQRELGVEAYAWEPEAGPPPREGLRGVDVVFHLAGDPVAEGRWTEEKKRRIADSRKLGTRNLVAGLSELETRPRVLVSASAVGYYGDRGDIPLDEGAAAGQGFLAEVGVAWEREAMNASQFGIRVVCARIGLVLARGGGVLGRMLTPFRMGAGGPLGTGEQWMPWIHIDDAVGLLLHASHHAPLSGPMNVVAPSPVTNADFTRALGHAVHRPAFVRVPKWALRLALGEVTDDLLASQRAVPRVAEQSGYTFEHPNLSGALENLLQDR